MVLSAIVWISSKIKSRAARLPHTVMNLLTVLAVNLDFLFLHNISWSCVRSSKSPREVGLLAGRTLLTPHSGGRAKKNPTKTQVIANFLQTWILCVCVSQCLRWGPHLQLFISPQSCGLRRHRLHEVMHLACRCVSFSHNSPLSTFKTEKREYILPWKHVESLFILSKDFSTVGEFLFEKM